MFSFLYFDGLTNIVTDNKTSIVEMAINMEMLFWENKNDFLGQIVK